MGEQDGEDGQVLVSVGNVCLWMQRLDVWAGMESSEFQGCSNIQTSRLTLLAFLSVVSMTCGCIVGRLLTERREELYL